MKKHLFLTVFIVAGLLLSSSAAATTSVTGRTIALDAGHGENGATGAVGYCDVLDQSVAEHELNVQVRDLLREKLVADGAEVITVPHLETRKERALYADENGAEVLISIHHNGSTNTNADYTQSFVTQKKDKEFAQFIHPLLVNAFGPDRGIKNDGYGMTVYGSMPGVLTESFFITNTQNACDVLASDILEEAEAEAMYQGLIDYFATQTSDDGGDGDSGGGQDCPPGKEKQGKCN